MASLNRTGVAHARAQIAAGNVNRTSAWSFSAEDGNRLLGPDGDDWSNYARWHLGVDDSAPERTKDRYKYPFGKGGRVYRSALVAIRQRAAQQEDTAIFEAAGRLLEQVDGVTQDAAAGAALLGDGLTVEEAERAQGAIASAAAKVASAIQDLVALGERAPLSVREALGPLGCAYASLGYADLNVPYAALAQG